MRITHQKNVWRVALLLGAALLPVAIAATGLPTEMAPASASMVEVDGVGYAIGDGPEGRIPILEWAVSQELTELIRAIEPTQAELDAVARRQEVTKRPELVAEIASLLGEDRFAGVWLDLDGTFNVGYVGQMPRLPEFPAHDVISYNLEERDKTLRELEILAAERDHVVDVRTGTTQPADPRPVVLAGQPDDKHTNPIPGLEITMECDDDDNYSEGTWGFNVTWKYGGVRKYGWLTAAHLLTASAAGCDPAVDGPISGNDVDVAQDHAADPDCGGAQHCWDNRVYKGIRDLTASANGTMDAVVITMPASEGADNRVHLGPGDPVGDGGPDDWTGHSTEVSEVRTSLSNGLTLCMVTQQQGNEADPDFVQCGEHVDRYAQNDLRFELTNAPHGICTGDSGGPIVDAQSNAAGGPRAVGIMNAYIGTCYSGPTQTVLYFWTKEIVDELQEEFSAFGGASAWDKLLLCGEDGNANWDYDCD